MIDSIQDVPGAFIGLGWRALGLLLAVCAVLATALSLLFVAVTTDAFSWLTVAALVGAIFGAMIAVFAVFAIRRAFGTLRDYFQGEQDRMTRDQLALLAERRPALPAPRTDAERLAVTTGIEIVMVGNLIDKRDLHYFCSQIAVTKDWTARKWEGITLPFGYKISNKDTGGIGEATSYAKLIALFTSCRPPLIADRSEGKTGTLTETDPRRMVARIIGASG